MTCAVDGCERPRRGRGQWCNLHRQRMAKHGDPSVGRWPETLARLMAKIHRTGCWEWTGSRFGNTGYGQVWFDGTNRLAHRVIYELLVGPIPAGLQLDHLCRNRACVNPDHLEPVTAQENTRRRDAARRLSTEGTTA